MTTETLNHLRSQISTLSESERATLARELIMSLDGPVTTLLNKPGTRKLFGVQPRSKAARLHCSAAKNSGQKCERG